MLSTSTRLARSGACAVPRGLSALAGCTRVYECGERSSTRPPTSRKPLVRRATRGHPFRRARLSRFSAVLPSDASVWAVPTRIVLSGGVEVTVNDEPRDVRSRLGEDLKAGEPFSMFQKEAPSTQHVLVAPQLVAYFEDRYVETDGPLLETVG